MSDSIPTSPSPGHPRPCRPGGAAPPRRTGAPLQFATVAFPDGLVLLGLYNPVTDTVHPSLVRPEDTPLPELLALAEGDAARCSLLFDELHRRQHGCDAQHRVATICMPAAAPAGLSLLEAADRMLASAEPVRVAVPGTERRWHSTASRELQVLVGILVPA